MEEWEYRQKKEKKETHGKEVNYGEEIGCSIEGEENG
jgi:hypothetical protein